MVQTVYNTLAFLFVATLLMVGFATVTFAEEDVVTDEETTTEEADMEEEMDEEMDDEEEMSDEEYEDMAEDKIDLVEDALADDEEADDSEEGESKRGKVKALLAEARELHQAGEHRAAYAKAKEAFQMLNRYKEAAKDHVKEECMDDDGCAHMGKKKRVVCKMDMLKDGERDRKFCRNGEWKEKREARLEDLLAGFVEAADLDEEQTEAIRGELQSLIRQLIMRMLGNRAS